MDSKIDNSKIIKSYTVLVSLILIAAGITAAFYTGEGTAVFSNLLKIILSPSKSLTDYFGYGSLGAAYINAGLCGLAVALPYIFMKASAGAGAMTAYFLIIAHAFFGKNILNIWPCMIGTYIFFCIRKVDPKKMLHVCAFTSCFGPMVSEILYRYTLEEFNPETPTVTALSIILTVVLGLFIGFVFPFVLTFTGKISKGFNLYNAGLAGGVIGTVLCYALFKIPGKELHPAMAVYSEHYLSFGKSYMLFANIVFALIAIVSILLGRKYNEGSLNGYKELLKSKDGVFADKFGMGKCMINIGIYALYLLVIYDIIMFVTGLIPAEFVKTSVGFTGPTTGALFAALSFACTAQSPSNTWQIICGYVIYSLFSLVVLGNWPLTIQAYLCTMAFATGLCPIVQKRGSIWGIIAGIIAASICTFPVKLHGGLMIYNSGFNAGLVALIMVVIFAVVDKIKPKKEVE